MHFFHNSRAKAHGILVHDFIRPRPYPFHEKPLKKDGFSYVRYIYQNLVLQIGQSTVYDVRTKEKTCES